MSTVTTILVLLTALALTAALGKRVAVPLPLLRIAAGVGISFVPGLERVDDTLREIETRLDSAEMHVTGAAQSAH